MTNTVFKNLNVDSDGSEINEQGTMHLTLRGESYLRPDIRQNLFASLFAKMMKNESRKLFLSLFISFLYLRQHNHNHNFNF